MVPTNIPTVPSSSPSTDPTVEPTFYPSNNPTLEPTEVPTYNPTQPTTNPSSTPSKSPTEAPTDLPSTSPTFAPEWRAENCIVDRYIDAGNCGPLNAGDYWEYPLRPQNCNVASAECIYDDSNGKTDCEYTRDYDGGEVRPCWVLYVDGKCAQCNCDNCDDDSRGNSP